MVSEHARATEHARESSARGVRSVVGAVGAIIGRVPVHPLLFAAFAVLFLYAANLHEVLPVDAALPLARNVAGAAIVLAVLSVVFRSVARGAIVATAIVVAYVAFGHVASVATGSGLDDRAQLVAWGLVIVAAVAYAIRARASLPRVTTGLNVVAGLLVISSLVTILPYELGRAGRGSSGLVSEVQAAVSSTGRQRDIYFLIFDRYGSADAIQRRFGITSDLYDWLRGQGFHVPASSHANYRATDFSLAATLNMRFLDDLTREVGRDTGDRTPARALIQDHEVGRFLQARGYRYYQLGSWFGPTHHVEIADENIALGETSEFESRAQRDDDRAGDRASLRRVWRSASAQQQSFRDRVSEGTLLELRQLRRVSTAPGPKFVFAHILLPHDPYVFHADGSIIPEAESRATDEKDLYAGQVAYANARIREIVGYLLSGPEEDRPIVIIEGDEGPLACRNTDCPSTSAEYLRIRLGNLVAMYLPGVDVDVPETFTSVNTFRLVFSEYFGADLPPLPDHSFTWPDDNHVYDFRDVTNLIGGPPEGSSP